MINILTGLVKKTSGESKIFGFDTVTEFRNSRVRIGLSPQELNFDHFFNIRDMLALQGGYYGLSFKTGLEKADVLLDQFGLNEKKNAKARDLSGGMKCRGRAGSGSSCNVTRIRLDQAALPPMPKWLP